MRPKRKKRLPKILIALVLLLAGGGAYWFFWGSKKSDVVEQQEQIVVQNNEIDEPNTEPAWDLPKDSLQTPVEDFIASHKGYYSIVILNPDTGTQLAAIKTDTDHFAASLYKLWVAYEGYRKIDDGTFQSDEIYLNGWTRAKCLDEMIRSSYSPCAEKMWRELGTDYLTEKAQEYGAQDTNLVSLQTNAQDVSTIMRRIATGEGLSEASKNAYLDSMKTQDAKYRRGLPSGFSDSVVTYNKVGWNELVEWHDAALVDFGDNKRLVVVVLSENAGMNNIAALAKVIEAKVVEN